jgi:hypothetical protein
MAYLSEEKETTCVYDYIKEQWRVYSCVPIHIRKLFKIAEPYWEEKVGKRVIAAKWMLNGNQVRFAIATVTKMSEKNKESARSRMELLHKKRKENVIK